MRIILTTTPTYSQDYLNTLSEFGFIPLVYSYTRIKNKSKLYIDHIFVKDKKNLFIYAYVFHNDIPDHFLVTSITESHRNLTKKYQTNLIKRLSMEKLKQIVNDESRQTIYQSDHA